MEKTRKRTNGKDKYFKMLFALSRKMEMISIGNKNTRFNSTEARLIEEIISAKYEGKRLISTQLAKGLGITRSAVSQIVDRLEKQGVVQRVADEIDRKIAYIELTEDAHTLCKNELKVYVARVNELVEKFGAERFDQMCELCNEFCDLVENSQS